MLLKRLKNVVCTAITLPSVNVAHLPYRLNTHILHFEVNATKVHQISSPKAEGIVVYQLVFFRF